MLICAADILTVKFQKERKKKKFKNFFEQSSNKLSTDKL
jgi:hypothetical protein